MYHIVVNPIAGKGRTLDKLPLLTRLFDAHKLQYEVIVTQAIMDAYQKAKAICTTGSDGIIGIGGDGTIQEIAAGMAAAFTGSVAVPLGIFPGGSGNDFVMTLADGKTQALARYKNSNVQASIEDFFTAVRTNRVTQVDLITANGMAFMNIGNVGLDARVVRNAVALKHRYGRYAYVAAVYKSIAKHMNMPLTVEIDGKVHEGEYTLVAICNGQYYGGGLHISPQAKLADGKITLCLVTAMSRLKTMTIFPYLVAGQHHRLGAVSYIECEEVCLTLKSGTESLSLDGNLYEIISEDSDGFPPEDRRYLSPHKLPNAERGEMRFKIVPGAMKVFL
ncbi:MAG: hypothetical protein FWC92_10705 [Defluviitaleaceae bacterium]|nr:hypothetical protein [Defluviitaleaceae bacterium]